MLLITGICGRTGEYFIKRLISENYGEVFRCIVKESTDTTFLDNSGLNFQKYIGDLNDIQFLKDAMEGIDTVIHIAYIFFSLNIAQAALEKHVKWLILVHTTGIYSKYKSAALVYQEIEERLLEITKDKISTTILRPTMIYGKLGDNNMEKFIEYTDKLFIYPLIGNGKNLLQPIHVKDLGFAYYDVLVNSHKTKGKNYILSGDRPISMKYIISLIAKKLGKKRIMVYCPVCVAYFMAYIIFSFTKGKIDYREKVLRMGEDRHYPHYEARLDFGFSPIAFEEGIKEEIWEYMDIKKDL